MRSKNELYSGLVLALSLPDFLTAGKVMQRFPIFSALLLVVLVGCGGGQGHPVEGKVMYEDGSPLTAGAIVFHPDDAKGITARGGIDETGAFKLNSDNGKTGAFPGSYKVTITANKPNPKDEYGEPIQLLPKKYANPSTSGLTATVPSESPDAYHFKVPKDDKGSKGKS
jgi:hypothetical protein